ARACPRARGARRRAVGPAAGESTDQRRRADREREDEKQVQATPPAARRLEKDSALAQRRTGRAMDARLLAHAVCKASDEGPGSPPLNLRDRVRRVRRG